VSKVNIESRGDGFVKAGHVTSLIKRKIRDSIPDRDIEYGTSSAKKSRTNLKNQPIDNLLKGFTAESGGGVLEGLPISQHFMSVPDSIEKVPLYHVGDAIYYGNPVSLYNTPNTGQMGLTGGPKADFKVRSVDVKPGDVVVQGRYKQAIKLTQDVDERPQILITNNFHSRPGIQRFEDQQRRANDKRVRIGYSSDVNINGSSLYMAYGTFPEPFKLGTEIEILKEKSKNADAVKDLYEDRINQPGKPSLSLYMQETTEGFVPSIQDNNMLLASNNIYMHTPNFNKKGTINMLSSGHMNLTSFSNIKLTVANPDKISNDIDGQIGKIFLGDPFSQNAAVKGDEYTNTMQELLSIVLALTNTLQKLNGKLESGSNNVTFKHLQTALEPVITSITKLKTEVVTNKKDLSKSIFVQ